VNYEELQSGNIDIFGKKVKTAPLSSIGTALKIAEILKKSVSDGSFKMTQPVELFDISHQPLKKLGVSSGGVK
jgi:uncharacterized protein (DUF39 family)